jgi:release factor glutamine methyltransferase
MRLQEALRQGFEELEGANIPSARLAAELLLMHALDCDRTCLYAHPERELTDVERVHYGRYLSERITRKPTQYITGRQEFWGLEFRVTPAVLIPRPETEHVVERALELVRGFAPSRRPMIIDVGTGSGCIAAALASELSRAVVVATDISEAALQVAAGNAQHLLGARIAFCHMNLLDGIADACMDVVASNPPYVPKRQAASLQREIRDFEPPTALLAGEEGPEVYLRLVPEAARVLRPGGWAVFELGFGMTERVEALFGGGWADVSILPDLAGIPRVISARRL